MRVDVALIAHRSGALILIRLLFLKQVQMRFAWLHAAIVLALTLALPFSSKANPTFTVASPDRTLAFPRDHGEHPSFETEWWYLTGQLTTSRASIFSSPADYGFQLTFFRRAAVSGGAINQIYLAHAALSDIRSQKFYADRRIASGGLGLAGAAPSFFRVFHLDWHMELIGQKMLVQSSVPIGDGASVELRLISEPTPPPLLHGRNGFSRKAPCDGCASMYYSFPRLELSGQIVRQGTLEQVHGIGWFDHEFMTNALAKGQEGWDWMSLMFQDGTSLMLFRLRSRLPETAWASGTLRRGETITHLAAHEFTMEPTAFWTSPTSGTRYPSAWTITVPNHKIAASVATLLPDQELRAEGEDAFTYYEGAVRTADGSGLGYVELTGYDKPIDGKL